MTLSRVMYLVLSNSAMAAGVLFASLGVGEYLIPGFASPFIDVVHLGLVVCALSLASALLHPFDLEHGTFEVIWQVAVVAVGLVAGGYLLWATGIADSAADLALLCAYGVLSVTFLIATIKRL